MVQRGTLTEVTEPGGQHEESARVCNWPRQEAGQEVYDDDPYNYLNNNDRCFDGAFFHIKGEERDSPYEGCRHPRQKHNPAAFAALRYSLYPGCYPLIDRSYADL